MKVLEKTHYEVLGVARNASVEQIKKSYREKLLSTHPDKTQKQVVDADIIPRIKLAYSTLVDTESKAQYDRELEENFKKVGLISTGEGLDVFNLDEFECVETEEDGAVVFVRDCPRCTESNGFVLSENDLESKGVSDGMGGYEIIIQCSACSLWLKIRYFDLQDESAAEDTVV